MVWYCISWQPSCHLQLHFTLGEELKTSQIWPWDGQVYVHIPLYDRWFRHRLQVPGQTALVTGQTAGEQEQSSSDPYLCISRIAKLV